MRNAGPLLSLERQLRAGVALRLEALSERGAMLGGMGQGSGSAHGAVADISRRQGDLVTRSQVLSAGMTESALRHKIRADGPWKIVLPGIYLLHNGGLTEGQREIATVLYAGRESVITGPAALRRQGVRIPQGEIVDVLIPEASGRQSIGFVRTHRTIRMPGRPWLSDGIRWAPVARAVADTSRAGLELRDVRALVADAVQRRKCTVRQLADELRAGPNRESGKLRSVLDEVAAGIASAAEGDLRSLIKRAGLPEPMYNPDLYVGSEFLARPDAWWRDAWPCGRS